MIHPALLVVCALCMLTAGMLEIVAITRVRSGWDRWFVSRIMAIALLMLAGRVAYIVYAGETARLNMWGMGPLMLISLSRIMASVAVLRARMDDAPAVAKAMIEEAAEQARALLADAALKAINLLERPK